MTTYGAISDEELDEKEANLKTRIFDITQPMVHLYQAVEDLQELALASNSPFSEQQCLALGLCLVKNLQELKKHKRDGWKNQRLKKPGQTSRFTSPTNGINYTFFVAPPCRI